MTVRKVLIVDDSKTDTRIVSEFLTSHGYSVLTARNADEGVRKAREEVPDCILMDIVMPGTSGFQATRILAGDPATSDIPVVMLSSRGQESDKIWAGRQGAADYLVKPVRKASLISTLKEL